MRTFLRSKVRLLFMTCAVLLAIPAVALADNLQDSIEVGAQKKTIGTGNGNTWTNKYWVQATGSGTSGCDIATTSEAVTFKLNVPAGVTASSPDGTNPDGSPKLVFNACGNSSTNAKSVTFSSNTPGIYNISATYVSGGGSDGDTFNENPANLELTVVNAPTVTAISPGDNATGVALNADVTATFSEAMDATAGDGDPSTITTSTFTLVKDGDATNTPISAAVTYDSGTNTAKLDPSSDLLPNTKYNATVVSGDNGVRTSTNDVTLAQNKTWSFTTLNPDSAKPTNVLISINDGAAWTNSASGNVSLDLSASDNVGVTKYRLAETQAGLDTASDVTLASAQTSFSASDVPFTLGGSEAADKTVWLRVYDAAGNFEDASDTIGWDKTPPTITDLGPTASPNGAGWYKTDVTNRFKASDSLSGLNSACVTNFPLSTGNNVQSKTTSGEGTAVNVTSDPCTDVAGNTATGVQSANFMIDKSNPNAPSATADRVPDYDGTGSNDWYKDTVTVTFTDNGDPDLADGNDGSGVNLSTLSGPVTKNTSGSHTVSDTVDDNAGNTSALGSLTVQVDATAPDLTLTCPSSPVIVGSDATASWSATDAHSGIAGASSGTIELDTDTIGSGQTATAVAGTAKDNVNHDSAAKTCNYSVAGDFNGFLQPIDGHSVNTGKYGRTYPIKWQLRDSSGALISDSAAQLLVGMMSGGQKAVSCTSFDLSDSDALEESTTGNTALRYDATSDQFIYNYKAPTSGTCYVFAIRYADGVTTQQIDFKFTK
jgi:hypothetical protein